MKEITGRGYCCVEADRLWRFRSLLRCLKLGLYFLRFGLELLLKQPQSREARAEWLHRFCAAALRGFGVGLSLEGTFPERGSIIANHQSYLDIVVFAGLHRCVFCSKAEIQGWPVVGWMTVMAGTVFVERGRGGSALKAKGGMQAAAEAGLPVVFFPEGTTSNGHDLLPFHSGLLAQAMEVEEPIWAAFVRYTLDEDNGRGVSVEEQVAWTTAPLVSHIWRFMGLKGVHATVRFAEVPVSFSSADIHRKLAAVEAREAMLQLAGGVKAGPADLDAAAEREAALHHK